MLFLLITCLSSFIFIFNYSLPLKPLPSWASSSETRLISFFFFKDLFSLLSPSQMNNSSTDTPTTTSGSDHLLVVKDKAAMSVLDLPDLALESILERLPPDALFRVSSVCSDLRERCLSDHLWRNHFYRKWASIIGPAAYRQWHCHISSSSSSSTDHSPSCLLQSQRGVGRGLFAYLSRLWPFMLVRSTNSNSRIHNFNHSNDSKRIISRQSATSTSVVDFYQALESGKFWFPAQVFNRENGHVGFMLSCYDAELCYDSCTDTFQARYPPHGRRAVALESLITWDRLRAAPVDTSPHDLHVSDCLNDLQPKDHIEIQWRRNKEFPYGWWYGVVGHLETCDGNETYCRCHESDTVVLEFNQYTPGSRWRHTTINRKDHREEGNELDGFYGGIRKLNGNDEISMWKHFWPAEILE